MIMSEKEIVVPQPFKVTWNSQKTNFRISLPKHERIKIDDEFTCTVFESPNAIKIVYTKKEAKK